MSVIKSSIRNPIPVFVGIVFIFIMGIISFYQMPYQLTPSVDEPMVSVYTEWIGATPYEVEREIIEEQEKVLMGLQDLVEMESSSNNGFGEVMLTFKIGTDVDQHMNRVSNKLNEVQSYPENVEKPVVKRSGEAQAPKIWMVLSTSDDNNRSINTYRTYLEDELLPYLLRLKGVADIDIFGGAKSQMEVVLDFVKMASYGITVPQVIEVLDNENKNISAGIQPVGGKDYRVRTTGQFNSPNEIEDVIVISDSSRTVRIKDIAYVKEGISRLRTYFRFDRMKDMDQVDSSVAVNSPRYHLIKLDNGENRWRRQVTGLDIGIKSNPDANVIELTDLLEEKVEDLNKRILKDQGLFLEIVYDERDYPLAALSIVKDNIIIGCLLAIIVLFIFLRNVSSTVIVAFVIPVTAVSTFTAMYSFGLSLNVVSLAGISFAVGMLVDNAIVVIENIERHRSMAEPPDIAASNGASEVWAAILASTLTTIAVFLPVVFIKQEAGQLFRDISIAISAAIFLSLIASVLVIPMLTNLLQGRRKIVNKEDLIPAKQKTTKINQFLDKKGKAILDGFILLLRKATKTWKSRLTVISGFFLLSAITTIILMPQMEYLPQGNMNFLVNILIPPTGSSYEEREQIATHFFDQIEPHFSKEVDGFPSVEYTFFVGGEDLIFCGAQATDPERCGELVPLFSQAVNSYPGVFGISMQTGIFQNRLGRARTVSLNISGYDQQEILKVAGIIMNQEVPVKIKNAQIRAVPSLDVSYPEVRFIPDRSRLAAVGFSSDDIGKTIDVMLDGRKIGDYKEEGKKKIDFVVKAPKSSMLSPEDIYYSTIPLPNGKSGSVFEFVDLKRTFGLTQIRHLDTKRTITLEINPPAEIALQEAMRIVEEDIVPKLENDGLLKNVEIDISGNASKFSETQHALKWNFLLAILILYFIMAVIFRNFIYPLIVLFTIPFALAGGFVGLKLANIFIADTPFDIMTMLGFIMLIGMMVNNPILIIHQSINNIELFNMEPRDAVIESTISRIRPIYMSVLTTIFGMLPLVLAPGSGSELYRGLGSVVLSGLFISTFFTIFVVPSALLFVVRKEKN
jgi:hydrophobic/amphiphilic exporter-1 (mainly G- bacteria), HAE1 family